MSRDIFPKRGQIARKVKKGAGLKVRTGIRHGLCFALAAAGLGLALFAFSVPPSVTVPVPEKGFCYAGPCFFEAVK